MDVVEAGGADFAGFLSLAAEVEEWFGPMVDEPGFHAVVERKIRERKAFVVRAEDRLLGGLMIGGAGPEYHLSWLVVSAAARGRGVGKALIRHATEGFRRPCRVDVITFGRDHPGAITSGARAFYERLGFREGGEAPDGPEGGSRQHYVLELT
jgi:ribosomal protein S18 acetylase RimI-like enzyme